MFFPFEVEQYLSENEQNVRFNFSESGVHPLSLGELLELAGTEFGSLQDTLLDYPEVRGTQVLRERIAALYDDVTADQVLVTVGASEANHLVASTLLERGDRVLCIEPSYLQLAGNAKNRGIVVDTVAMNEADGWALDTAALDANVTAHTKLISVVNPHNPTGHILSAAERAAIINAASRVGAWIIADEVYAGTERGEHPVTPSFWGTYDRVIAINSMSKAYGLPGTENRLARRPRAPDCTALATPRVRNNKCDYDGQCPGIDGSGRWHPRKTDRASTWSHQPGL